MATKNMAVIRPGLLYGRWFALMLQVERNIQKVSDAYESLAQHSQKRENLEKLMRLKLDSEISRLTEVNQQVQGN